MAYYQIVHTVNSSNSEKENTKLTAARALYTELLKYYSSKTMAKKSA